MGNINKENYTNLIIDIGVEYETFTHFHEVPLDSSEYFNTCWTKINFSQGVENEMVDLGILADPNWEYGDAEAATAGVFNLLESIGGIILNSMIILVIMRNPKIRQEYLTPSILSISVIDFFFSVYILPIMTTIFFTKDVPFTTGCKTYGYIGYSLWLSVALNLLGIGILRSYVIFFPQNVKQKRFQYACKLTPIGGWIIGFLTLFPTFLGKFGQFAIECRHRMQII